MTDLATKRLSQAEFAARHIAHVEVRFLHRADHYTWLDQPEATWGVVLPFLAGLR